MGKRQFIKPEAPEIRGLCCLCELYPQKKKSNGKYGTLCSTCDKRFYEKDYSKKVKLRERPYYVHKKNYCEKCGFTSPYPCQFDVDHIDGNHFNNELSNLQTLCSNCHRLKTYLNKDWLK